MIDVSQFSTTTDANSSKYLTDSPYTNSYSSASVVVGVSSYATRTFVVPLSDQTRLYALWVNVSLDGDVYVRIPNRDRSYASNARIISTTMSSDGTNATITMYLVNASGVSQTFPAFDVNIIRRDYVDEL